MTAASAMDAGDWGSARRRRLLSIWLAVAAILILLLVPLWRPLGVAWLCYSQYANEVRQPARVLHKLEDGHLVLQIVEGHHAGQSCMADTSTAIYESTEIGSLLDVVHLEERPGECELDSTIVASGYLLWAIGGFLAVVLLVVLGAGLFLHRSFSRPVFPPRRLGADPAEVRCPACGKRMDEGYVPLLSGLHWRGMGEPIGLPHVLGGLPGTVGWWGRPRLHAFRCTPCEVVTLQYGRPDGVSAPVDPRART